MKTILVICSIFVAVQADLVERNAGASIPNNRSCFLPKAKNAVSQEAINLLRQELNKHQANEEVDLGNWHDGVTKATVEVLTAAQGCPGVYDAVIFIALFSMKNKTCVLERAKAKDMRTLTNYTDHFLADYGVDREVAQEVFKEFSMYSVGFFYGNLNYTDCKPDPALCFLERTKDVNVNDTIKALEVERAKYQRKLPGNLNKVYDVALAFHMRVAAAVSRCDALPSAYFLFHLLAKKGKDCMIREAKNANEDNLYNAIRDFSNSYTQNNHRLHLDYHKRFLRGSLGYFYDSAAACNATANPGTDRK